MTDISQILARYPRTRLLHLPTKLEPMPQLGAELGLPFLYMKRDDSTGLAGGGNKTRKLEYVVAEAIAAGADTLITTGAIQSNHARQTAGIAARMGLKCHLVLQHFLEEEPHSYLTSGNFLLDQLFGAEIHEVADTGQNSTAADGDDDGITAMSDDQAMEELADKLRAEGCKPYIVCLGASSAVGSLGYAECASEIAAQSDVMGGPADWVVHASGSCGTQAGLIAGFAAMGEPTQVLGIGVSGENQDGRIALVKSLAQDTAELLRHTGTLADDNIHVDGAYVGEGYGMFGDDVREAVSMIARTEGVLIDPIYTGKALAGLIDLAGKGFFKPTDKVVFLHTGGWPALFAYADQMRKSF